jgi:hypothetical protein
MNPGPRTPTSRTGNVRGRRGAAAIALAVVGACSCSMRSLDQLGESDDSSDGVLAAGGTEEMGGAGAQGGSPGTGGVSVGGRTALGGSAGSTMAGAGADAGSAGTNTSNGGTPPVAGGAGGDGGMSTGSGGAATSGGGGSSGTGEAMGGASGAPGTAGASGAAGGAAGATSTGCTTGDPCPLEHETAYRLVPGHNPDACVDVRARSFEEGAFAQQYTNRAQSNQIFWAEARGNDRFSFRNAQSGKCLEVSQASLEAGAPIQQRACTGAAHQLWRPLPVPDGLFRLVAEHSGLVLDVQGPASEEDSELIVQNPIRDLPDSTWQLRPTDRGAFVALRASELTELRAWHEGAEVSFGAVDGVEAEWKVVSGLADAKCVSFESRDQPGRFLRHANGLVSCEPRDEGAEFAADATFCLWDPFEDLDWGYAVIEPFSRPGEYLVHDGDGIVTAPFEDTEAFHAAATWFIREP